VKRIFVIDDEAAMGENIQRMLKFPETTVTAYTDPVKGLADALGKRGIRIGHAVTDVRLVETPVEPHAPPTPA